MASRKSCPTKGSATKIQKTGKPCNRNQDKDHKQKLDSYIHAVEISIRNCTRPGCKHHTTSDHICVWPNPCPADCFEQHPVTTRTPKNCVWPAPS